MTKEDRIEAEARAEENIRKRIKLEKKRAKMATLSSIVRPWAPPIIDALIMEFLYPVMEPHMLKYGYTMELVAAIDVTIHCVVLALAAAIVNALGGGILVIMFYSSLYYLTDGKYIYIIFSIIWMVNKISRIFSRTREATMYEELAYTSRGRTYNSSLRMIIDGYAPIFIILGSGYFLFQTQYGFEMQSLWLVIVIITLTKVLPGAGGNSTTGVITLGFILLVAFLSSPDVFRALGHTFKELMQPPPNAHVEETADPVASYVTSLRFGYPGWLNLGYSRNSILDAIRKTLCYVPMIWTAIDDLMGPGVAVNAASCVNQKNKEFKEAGWAAIYDGTWWIVVSSQLFVCCWMEDVYSVLTLLIAGIVSWYIWNIFGRREWVGRGQGVTLTTVRAGYAMVFGQGPEGQRTFVLRVCNFLGWVCLVIRHRNNFTALGFGLASLSLASERATCMMLGVCTHSPVWLIKAWREDYPVTRSIKKNKTDAYTPDNINDPG
uniref:VP3 n=1 Tax=Neuropteran jingmen-related virus TaxID=2822568 RepID=A0A8A6RQ97_9FLAV|nr:VP3 [Neuropteran jingmen-related virus]